MKKSFSKSLAVTAFALAAFSCGLATATPVAFVAPNDIAGKVFSSNSNDGWSSSRGIGFTVSSDQTIDSVGLLQNLSNTVLNYDIVQISSLTGNFTKLQTLRSGSASFTTSGLQWIDFNFANLALTTGNDYLIEFSFNSSSNQNFFYNNKNVAWNQDSFLALEGTAGNNFSNSVVGAFRVDTVVGNDVPEPESLALVGLGLAGLGFMRRKAKKV